MKKILFLLVLASSGIFAQTTQFPFEIKLIPTSLLDLPGLHSFASAELNGKWIIIGGRKDGLHARQPFNAFPASNNNELIYVLDKANNQYWTASVNTLPVGLKEQLQSTNMNEFQVGDKKLLIRQRRLTLGYMTTGATTGQVKLRYLVQ